MNGVKLRNRFYHYYSQIQSLHLLPGLLLFSIMKVIFRLILIMITLNYFSR
nr:MAG TPA_asm: hypothetical protein [Caudoviricetes sp.]